MSMNLLLVLLGNYTDSQHMFTLTKHMLNDIVAILVLQKLFSVLVKLFQHWGGLVSRAVLQNALDHPAAIRVS